MPWFTPEEHLNYVEWGKLETAAKSGCCSVDIDYNPEKIRSTNYKPTRNCSASDATLKKKTIFMNAMKYSES